jgi:hypothetical protein
MEDKNIDLFSDTKIKYSDKVYVDVKACLNNKENEPVIWKHLYTIWGLIDSTSHAKKLLQNIMKSDETGGNNKELSFLTDMIDDVKKSVEENNLDTNNPMALLTGLTTSGILPKLMTNIQTNMQNGDINLGKMVSGISNLLAGGNNTSGGSDIMSQLGPMMSQMAPLFENMVRESQKSMDETKKIE